MSAHDVPLADMQRTVADLRTTVEGTRASMEAAPTPDQRLAHANDLVAARTNIQRLIDQISPTALVSNLDATVPLALLPVRVETRFADAGTDLLHVRIFPDDLHTDGHDPELTDTEATLGKALWDAPNDLPAAGEAPPTTPATDATDGRRARWAALVSLYGGPRAAWIARVTRPVPAADGTITVPQPAGKARAYVRPPVARALPDRWLVRAFVGDTVVGEAWSNAVRADLHLAPDPAATAPPAGASSQPRVDPEMRWMIDYPTAVASGMGVDVALPAGTDHLDRVIVVGVRASAPSAAGATELARLLTAHRYSDGLGFLAQGTLTANAPDGRSGFDRRADPDRLWHAEFADPSPAQAAAPRLARVLGLPGAVLDGAEGCADDGDADARAMQTSLWAATWGYYLGQLLDASALKSVDIDAVRDHYLDFVRARGTLPVLRVGRQPYGVLPLVPLGRWVTDGADATVDGLARLLQRVRPLWQCGVGRPVTAAVGPGFDDAFARVMSTDAASRHFAIRSVIADRTIDPSVFAGIDAGSANAVIDVILGQLLGLGSNPLVLDILSPNAEPVRAPLVVAANDPNPDATAQTAIRNLPATNPTSLLTGVRWLRPTVSGPATVLHTLLRRSLLLEYANAGLRLGGPLAVGHWATTTAPIAGPAANRTVARSGAGTTTPPQWVARTSPPSMLIGLTPDPGGGFRSEATLPAVLSTPIASVTGAVATGEWLWRNSGLHVELRRSLDETLAALGHLAGLTAASLELLLRETLDTATHRWTAWAESVAADKLARLRSTAPTGVMIGGWAVVEHLDRRARTPVASAPSAGVTAGPLFEDTRPGGFLHAPSTAQAATAAVLRAAHLAHGGDADPAFAVDLSSGPARTALRLAAGVRAGQELGALLGYELERALHERNADVLVAPLRAYAPRWKASGTFIEGDAEEVVSPSAVVDGLALAMADPAAVAAAVLPQTGAGAASLSDTLHAELDRLVAHQHALADLLHAEAIHHALVGNTARAAGVLDAAHRGAPPPEEFEVLRTPRPGTALACRVALALPEAPESLAGGWPHTVRGDADAAVAAWLASVLPPVERVRIRVVDAAETISDAQIPAAARLGPLDVVLGRAESVRARVALQLGHGSRLLGGRDPGWEPTVIALDELLTVGADLRELLAARPLRPRDLQAPGDTAPEDPDVADLLARGATAREAVQAASGQATVAIDALETAAAAELDAAVVNARSALAAVLALGADLHLPDGASAAELASVMGAGVAQLTSRLRASVPPASATADAAAAYLKALLGANQPALPRFRVDPAVGAAVTAGLALGDKYLAKQPDLASDWLDETAPVRVPAGRAVAALQGCEALAGASALPGRWRIIETATQMRGAVEGQDVPAPSTWSATMDATTLAPYGPAATIVAWVSDDATPAASNAVRGLLLDEWSEVVPEAIAATSVVYQAEAPAARAPQAVLLALAPDTSAGWDTDTLVDVVVEAVELAGLRTVDAETGAWFGRLLPAVVLPDGDSSDVIAAPPRLLLEADATVLAAEQHRVKGLG